MATPIKPWPNEMKEARDLAAEALVRVLATIRPLTGHRDDIVKARSGIAMSDVQFALRLLEYAGAATRPTDGCNDGDV